MMATTEMPVTPGLSVLGSGGYDWCKSTLLRTFCGLVMTDQCTWLSYAKAAKRVRKSKHTIQLWRREGMPMEWRLGADGQMERVVELAELQRAFRQAMSNSPVHFYKMRAKLIEAGETPPPLPERFKRARPENVPGIVQNVSIDVERNASQPQGVSEYQEDPTHGSDQRTEAFLDVLRELPEFVGQAEHAALMAAMEHEPPACDGLEVFTRDRFDDPEEVEMMRGICRECPLLQLCATFAAAGKPSGGMWAGKTPAEVRQIPDGFRAELAPSAA